MNKSKKRREIERVASVIVLIDDPDSRSRERVFDRWLRPKKNDPSAAITRGLVCLCCGSGSPLTATKHEKIVERLGREGRGSCNMSREGRGERERVDDNGSVVIRRLISSLGDTGEEGGTTQDVGLMLNTICRSTM